MPRIYVASSWMNPYYEQVVKRLREEGHEVYDFRNPPHGGNGFLLTRTLRHVLSLLANNKSARIVMGKNKLKIGEFSCLGCECSPSSKCRWKRHNEKTRPCGNGCKGVSLSLN